MSSGLTARLRSLPERARSIFRRAAPPPSLSNAPTNPFVWVALAHEHFDALPGATQEMMTNHSLNAGAHALTYFADEIGSGGGDVFLRLSKLPITPEVIALAIDEIVRRKTIAQCAYAHRSGEYFSEAERFMEAQWAQIIWPIIQHEDFTHTLDLACGHGRNTEFLRRHASTIDLVDVNSVCIESSRARFGNNKDNCQFRYHVTDGDGLAGIPSASLTFVYSWDSMVHFDKLVVRDYVDEIARVLKPGGTAFLHHSNFGALAPNSDWAHNVGTRSDMSAKLMSEYATAAGLKIKFQRLSGRADGWGMDDLDCLSLLEKPLTS